ncbi:MAG: PAS domain S-box protein, partial [Bacteroidota bacterium]
MSQTATQLFDLSNYSLNLYALPTFAVSCAILLIGILSLLRERVSLVTLSFFLTTFVFSLWFFSFSWMYCAIDEEVAAWWAKAGYVAIPFIPAAIYQFTVVELGIHDRQQKGLVAVWLLSFFFSTINLVTDAFIAGVYLSWWGYYPHYGWVGSAFLVFLFTTLFGSMRHYYREYHKQPPGLQQKRIRAFRSAWMIAYVATVDVLPKFGVALYPFGYVPIFLFALLSARAIWRYRLTDVAPAFAAKQIIDTLRDALVVLDRDGVIRFANKTSEELFTRPYGELIGQPFASALNGAFSAEQWQTLLREGSVGYEISYQRTSDHVRILSLSASVIRGREQEPAAIVATFRDITERRELTRRFEESQEKYQNIVENSLDGIAIVQDGKLMYVNPSAVRIFGYDSSEEMKTLSISATVAPASRPFVFKGETDQIIREDMLRNYEMKGLTKHGKVID